MYLISCLIYPSDFLVAVICYMFLFPLTLHVCAIYFFIFSAVDLREINLQEAKEWQIGWVSKVVAFNLVCEVIFYG